VKEGQNHGLNGLKDDTDYSTSEKSESIKSVQSVNPCKSVIQTGYKQTDVGVIPEDWEVKSLGELGHFKNGINKGKQDFGHGFPFVNLMDVFGVPKVSAEANFGLVNSSVAERNLYELRGGDVLFVRSSVKPEGVGLTTLIPEDFPDTVFGGFLIRSMMVAVQLTLCRSG
jgi:type I restriction enzyme S subunit